VGFFNSPTLPYFPGGSDDLRHRRTVAERREKSEERRTRNGRKRETQLFSEKAGCYSVCWSGADARGRSVPAGTYFYVLKANGRIAQKRMPLVR